MIKLRLVTPQDTRIILELVEYKESIVLYGTLRGRRQSLLSIEEDGVVEMHASYLWEDWGFKTDEDDKIRVIK